MLKREIIITIVNYCSLKFKKYFLAKLLTSFILFVLSTYTSAQSPNLGMTEHFTLFTSSGALSNTGASQIQRNVGSHAGAISGFGSPTTVEGTVESASAITAQAAIDLTILSNELLNTPQTVFGHSPNFGGGETVFPGVYKEAGAGTVFLDLILDGQYDSCAVFIFQFVGAFSTGAATHVKLINGARACNVFWTSGGAVALGASSQMKGTIICPGAVSIGAGSTLEGRVLSSSGAVSTGQVVTIARNITTWTGSVSSNWFNNANWSDGIPTNKTQVIIPANASNMPIIDVAGATLIDIQIDLGATLEISGSNQLDIYRNMDIQGSFIANASTLNFMGDCFPTSLSSSGTVSLYSVIVNKTSNVIVESGLWELRGIMSIEAGSFITNDSLTVISDSIGTASIGEITGAGISGEITMERYIDAGETNWRYIGSAVSGATIADFNDDFTTAGYPGSLFPNFGWVSIYTYDETLGPNLGYIPVSNANQNILTGQGIHVWCGDTITGTQPFVIDFTGDANQGDIPLSVSYTMTGTPDEDGWNHVANPYPSTIDWDDPDWAKTNIANATVVFNPDNGLYATYVSGTSTNNASRYIPSQQAFWVKAIGNSPVLIAKEGVKSNIDQPFLKTEEVLSPGLKIRISGNHQFDEVIVRNIEQATVNFDHEFDANKHWGGWGLYAQISLVDANNKDMTVHSFKKINQEVVIPIRAVVFSDGIYGIEFERIDELDVPCIKLEDTYTGIIYNVEEESVLLFEMYDTTLAPRFNLILAKSYETKVTDNSCYGSSKGEIIFDFDLPSIDYIFSSSDVILNETDFADPLIISGLASDKYTITIPNLINSCGVNTFNFVINPRCGSGRVHDWPLELPVGSRAPLKLC